MAGNKFARLNAKTSVTKDVVPSVEVKQPSNQATTLATKQPEVQPVRQFPRAVSKDDDYVETIRLALKEVGKETTSYRLHEKEKEALDEMLYQLKRRKLKSNENEVMRIAINFILGDYQANGDQSILVRALEHMRA